MRCSYQRSTALMCAINAFVLIFVLYGLVIIPHTLQRSVARLHVPSPRNLTLLRLQHTLEAKERAKKAEEARRAVEPLDLMKRVKELQSESVNKNSKGTEDEASEDPTLAFKEMSDGNRSSRQREGANESMDLGLGPGEAGHASPPAGRAGIKVEGGKLVLDGPEIEDGIIPGRPVPEACNAEPHTDYDGFAVTWGLTHHKESAADCCQACLDQARTAKEGDRRCNVWVYCPAEEGCFSPDIYEHQQFECWLKQTEIPTLNFRGRYSPEYQQAHHGCPQVVPWVSGVITPG